MYSPAARVYRSCPDDISPALPATVNAAVDAFRPIGVIDLQMPLNPVRIWSAIAGAGGRNLR
jgi:hypothetical protein